MAADKIDMSLDDIIKMTHVGRNIRGRRGARGDLRGNRGRKGTRGSSATDNATTSKDGGYDQCLEEVSRRSISGRSFGGISSDRTGQTGGVLRGGIQKRRLKPGFTQEASDAIKQHIEGGANGRRANPEGKLWIHNLDFGVKDADIQELFSVIGQLQKATVHYDSSGRSLGSAEVIFSTQAEALQALKEYNNVTLDGRPMKIRLSNLPQIANAPRSGFLGSIPGDTSSGRRFDGRGRGREVGGRGRGIGDRGSGRGPALTEEQLDLEIDDYNHNLGSIPGDTSSGRGFDGRGRGRRVGDRGRGIGGRGIGDRSGRGIGGRGGRGIGGRGDRGNGGRGGRGIGGRGGRGSGGRGRGRGLALTKEQLDFEIDDYNHNN